MIVFSRENFCETSNSLFHGDQLAGMACEYLGDLERLRKETLDLTCTATVSLSSSDNSSIPKIAIIS